mgnify:CR=1 FL=1
MNKNALNYYFEAFVKIHHKHSIHFLADILCLQKLKKKIIISGFLISLLFISFPISEIFAEEERCTENCSIKDDAIIKPDIERPKFYKEIEPDIHIDFSNNDGWEGLKDNRYWKVSQGE